ncbi:MAG: hypothetical protein GKR89_27910 [Candidatus Latescibacteria bacterium]|nr:hypothetical protein [Candidatus Latescibacterota bacterium]
MRHSRLFWRFGQIGVFALGLGLVSWHSASAQLKGHRVTSSRVVVNTAQHWQRWNLPTHTVDATGDGWVRPHFSRTRYNILDDMETFTRVLPDFRRKRDETAVINLDSTESLDVRGNIITDRDDAPIWSYFLRPGISRAGSNPQDAANILDGDPTTYWEPDPDDPLDTWWIEVDLGRVVAVDSLIMHFAEEGLGDPFRQFRVLAAPFQVPINQDQDEIEFEVLGGTRAPNQGQRIFGFGLTQFRSDFNWTGKMVEVIRIVVTETTAGRGVLISEEEWQALAPGERGDVVYFVQNRQGFEEPVDKAVYDDLDDERKGRIDYYIRERPRLADIETWGYGDNLSLGMVAGGGAAGFYGTQDTYVPASALDGDAGTNSRHLVWSPVVDRGILLMDIGATLWLDAFRMSSAQPSTLIDGYIIRGSDGSRDGNGQLKWRRLSDLEREHNLSTRYEHIMDVFPEPPKVRFMEITIVSDTPSRRGGYSTGPTIAEYQLFSEGYAAESVLISDLIELPGTRNLGSIFWEGEEPEGTSLEIRTRTGDLLGKQVRYFDKGGTEITGDAWKNLLGSFKGPADTTFVPTSGWSPWSRAYVQSGGRVTSPGLRKYLEIQVKMSSIDRNAAAGIRSIEIELVNPVAERLLAEVWPTQVLQPGVVDTFDVYLQPNFIENPASSRSTGFDEILLTLPGVEGLELLEVGLEADAAGNAEQVFRPGAEMGVFSDGDGAQIEVVASQAADSLAIVLGDRLNILPDVPRTYNRLTAEGEQVPVSQDGLPLTGASYGVLDPEERGQILYFRQSFAANGDRQLEEVGQGAYQELPEEEKGPIRYFRILRGDGAPSPFNDRGDSLDSASYNRLSTNDRGAVVGAGEMVRLRFKAPIFLNGTTLEMAVRNSSGGTNGSAPWQDIEAGDALPSLGSNTLSIGVPLETKVIDQFAISPNPFTPNGDGINDIAQIRFSVFRITSQRDARVRIYTLDGTRVWENHGGISDDQKVASGKAVIGWDGRDDQGNRVPPGLYICQVELDVDSDADSATRSHLIAVAY